MNWSKTKTIFIICFLLLDVFLAFELYERHQQDQGINGLADGSVANILDNDNVKLKTEIPETPHDMTFLKGKQFNFSNSDAAQNGIKALEKPSNGMTGQKVTFQNGGLVVKSVFRRPLTAPLSDSNLINNLLRFVYKGNLYQYWKTDNKSKTINFVQTFGNKPVFISSRSDINWLQFSMKSNKLTSYRQSFFKFDKTNVVDVISATTALNNLWEKDDIPIALHPVIERVEMGYLNLVGDAESNQLIFVPCWHIKVKTDYGLSEYFVNAVSGTVQTIE